MVAMRADSGPIVVALGGNAISPVGQPDSIPHQFEQTRRTSRALADLIEGGAPIVITHGNGPQIGSALRRTELARAEVYEIPLGVCVADLQGGMGYMISQCLANELHRRGRPTVVSTLVTNVVVDLDDPAFANPTKPIGSVHPLEKANELRRQGWDLVELRGGRGVRRVVPSPAPMEILELDLIRRMVAEGETLIAVGGGGIPVVRLADGTLDGREAVIDKDLASSLLARGIDAAALVIATGVRKVAVGFGTDDQQDLDALTVEEARRFLDAGEFPPGSMGPKILAGIEFVEGSTRPDARVVICDLDDVARPFEPGVGTVITR